MKVTEFSGRSDFVKLEYLQKYFIAKPQLRLEYVKLLDRIKKNITQILWTEKIKGAALIWDTTRPKWVLPIGVPDLVLVTQIVHELAHESDLDLIHAIDGQFKEESLKKVLIQSEWRAHLIQYDFVLNVKMFFNKEWLLTAQEFPQYNYLWQAPRLEQIKQKYDQVY